MTPAVDGRRYAGLVPQQRVADRYGRLMKAGTVIIGSKGFRSTTVAEICTTAGVAKRHFYESFEDLEAILVAVHAVAVAGFQQALALPEDPDRTVEEAVVATVTRYFARVQDAPELARVAHFEVYGVSARVDRAWGKAGQEIVATVLASLDGLVSARGIDSAQATFVAGGLVGAVTTIVQQWLLEEFATPVDEVVAAAVRVVLPVVVSLGEQ